MAAIPSQVYSKRAPSPPRVLVPPPPVTDDGIPDLSLSPLPQGSLDIGFGDHGWMQQVSHQDLWTKNSMLEWRYGQRRTAQKILPFLYLGPATVAKDSDWLAREGVSMILAVRDTRAAGRGMMRMAEGWTGVGETVDVDGNPGLIRAFPHGVKVINSYMENLWRQQQGGQIRNETGGKVLVFCETGNDRSAAMVAAYIMVMYNVDVVTAVQVVQSQRFCACFDDVTKNLLRTWEEMLRAKRDVARDSTASQITQFFEPADSKTLDPDGVHQRMVKMKPSKRTLDEVEMEDVDMDSESRGKGTEAGREGQAPFNDV
ncbi:MAG: hypothetical protein Q9190_002297 [Brigantiaea leucoxantha]